MAAKLRAEAAALEAEKAQAKAAAAERAFEVFDSNKDGQVSVEELKSGLEKSLQTELSERRVESLMKAFDASGDGLLQKEEFVTTDEFRRTLESLVQKEKQRAKLASKKAMEEAEAAALEEAKLELLNDSPPTTADRIVSVLPYLFPLLDGLQYGGFLLGNQDGRNPAIAAITILYALYRSIPLSGFAAFLALNFLSLNFRLNRLVRFNMQQAISIDIALIIPGLIFGLATAGLPALGIELPIAAAEMATNATFISLLLVIGYCAVSSILGITPDKVPIISESVNRRMPSIDMFDSSGRFIGPQNGEEDETRSN